MHNPTFTPPSFRPSNFIVCANRSEEARIALRLAYSKAYKNRGRVTILHVMQPPDFQGLHAVADRMYNEQRAEAETLMQELAEETYTNSGIMPGLLIEEGNIGDQIIKTAMEDPDASLLVVGVAEDNTRRGKLVTWLAEELGKDLLIPLMLVPGNLTEQQLQNLI